MAEEVLHHAEELISAATLPSSLCGALHYGIPTVERPFGVALWPLFRYISATYFNWDPEAFRYEYDSYIPMSKVPQVAAAIAIYYVVIFGGRAILTNVRPIRINWLFKIHNFFLTSLSLILLLLMAEEMAPIWYNQSLFYGICHPKAWTDRMEVLYYLNYLTKYYELLDTVFLVLRHRPLTFLHTYHHGATAFLCFCQLNGRTSVSWLVIMLNLGVHVIMYFYYLLAAFGIRPWWKHWVTRFQIIQFIIDLAFVYFSTYSHFAYKYWPNLPKLGDCAGAESAAVLGCLILSSYLVLFISFYIKSYLKPKRPAASKPVAAAPATKKTSTRSKKTVTVEEVADSSAAAPRKRTLRSRKA